MECKFYYVGVQTSSFTRLEIKDCSFYSTPLQLFNNYSIISGITYFTDSQYDSAISCYYGGNLTLSGNVTFANNNATRGGALALYSCTVNIAANTSVTFVNNSANHKGGAIYVDVGIPPNIIVNYWGEVNLPCFYRLLNCHSKNTYNFYFANNSANLGGDEIYGAFLKSHSCSNCNWTVNITSHSNSPVSSDALRVCLCDELGQPQCKNNSYLNITSKIYPGETFNISAVLVGTDFGLTTGTVYANIYDYDNSNTPSLTVMSDSNLIKSISECSEVEYSLYPQDNIYVEIYLTVIPPDNLI